MAMGQKENPWGPQVLVYFFLYQPVFWGTLFDPQPHVLSRVFLAQTWNQDLIRNYEVPKRFHPPMFFYKKKDNLSILFRKIVFGWSLLDPTISLIRFFAVVFAGFSVSGLARGALQAHHCCPFCFGFILMF